MCADGVEFEVVSTTTFVAPLTAENSQNLLCMIDCPNFGSPRHDLFSGQVATYELCVRSVPSPEASVPYAVLVGRSLMLDSSSSTWTSTPRFLAATSALTTDASHTW